ncbi:type VI secretion system protein ImpK [Pseudomonas sp. HMWF032]|uniref:DotU family type IV/VI secretion system protein n=1 Tax=Pseudomonas sp. HMWF032 TaxID=2056866 RepID=UPI000D3C54CD|nr:type VI secretion system protein ImpK [Pseudomonas sp. HMWF032]PTT83789.1 type VI secretion system protein ImpK [Pseudomonas sp. HMWF010]
MSARSMNLYPSSFGEAPLSLAFRQAWLTWCDARESIKESATDEAKLVELTAELATRTVRHLWRDAFASVGASAPGQVKAMVYAFVALLDERLLFDDWQGRGAWQSRPLEARLYGSRSAGERVPKAIHELLKNRSPSTRDLANVYLQCLLLGFYGALRSERGRALHARWLQALFTLAWQHEPSMSGVITSLEGPAITPPMRLPFRRALPDGLRLMLGVMGLVLLLTLAGHVLWLDIGSELDPALYLFNAPQTENSVE